MRTKRLAAVGSMFAWLLVFAVGGAARADKIYTIPWVDSGNDRSPLIRVAFKGGQTRLFGLDTGAPTTIIDRKVAAELHLSVVKVIEDGVKERDFAVAPLRLGPDALSLPSVQFDVADLSGLQSGVAGKAMAGIIGMDLLAKYTLRMDYSKKQVELIPGSVQGSVNEPMNAEKLPMDIFEGHYRFAGSLDSVPVHFIVDTGAAGICINEPEVLKRLKPRAILGSVKVGGFSQGLTTKVMTGHWIRLEELAFGRSRFKNPIVLREGFEVVGIWLGNDFLQRFQMVIDFPAKTLYLTPDPAFKEGLMEWDVLVGKPTLASPRPPENPAQTGSIGVIPFETLTASVRPLVALSLNGGQPHLFLVDPGMANCLLDEAFVKSEKLTTRRLKTEAETEVDAVTADRLVLQAPIPLTIENVPFGVHDLSSVRSKTGQDIVGVLGANLLRAFVERIDFSKRQIEFFARENFTPPGKPAHRLPLQTDEGLSYLNAIVDSAVVARFKIRFTYLDTILQDVSLLSTLKPVARVKKRTSSDVVGSETLRLHTLRMEEETWDSPILEHSADSDEYDNVLGVDFFSRFYVTLDLGAKQLYLEPDPNYQEDLTKWLGTGFSTQVSPEGKMSVTDVLAPSPASEAGVMPGDSILAIDGLPIATTPLETIFAKVKRVEGAVITVKIQRKGEGKPREFTMKMRKLL